jgi:hypothetical protein
MGGGSEAAYLAVPLKCNAHGAVGLETPIEPRTEGGDDRRNGDQAK